MNSIERNDEGLRAIASKRRWRWSDAKVVLEALDDSGVSIPTFCRKNALNYFRVFRWNQKRRQAQNAGKEQQRFLPLRVIEDTNKQRGDLRQQSWWVVQIELSDCLICVAEGASEAVVNRAVRAVRTTSC